MISADDIRAARYPAGASTRTDFRIRVNKDGEVKELPEIWRIEGVEPLENYDLFRCKRHRRIERTGRVVVDRLCDRVTTFEPLHVRFKLREVVRIRVERGNIETFPLLPVVPVVIVERDGGDKVRAEIWRMAFVNVVFPDPLSPVMPITKTSGDRAMISLKWGIRGMRNGTCDAICL